MLLIVAIFKFPHCGTNNLDWAFCFVLINHRQRSPTVSPLITDSGMEHTAETKNRQSSLYLLKLNDRQPRSVHKAKLEKEPMTLFLCDATQNQAKLFK